MPYHLWLYISVLAWGLNWTSNFKKHMIYSIQTQYKEQYTKFKVQFLHTYDYICFESARLLFLSGIENGYVLICTWLYMSWIC